MTRRTIYLFAMLVVVPCAAACTSPTAPTGTPRRLAPTLRADGGDTTSVADTSAAADTTQRGPTYPTQPWY